MKKLTTVMYHYVRGIRDSRYPGIRGLENDLFVEQIRYLMKNYNIIKMEDVIESLGSKRKLPDKAVLLTFDDGYLDHYINVYPIL